MYSPGQGLKSKKTYEVTKPQIVSYWDSHYCSRICFIRLQRIRAAGAIASDEHNHLGYAIGTEAFEW